MRDSSRTDGFHRLGPITLDAGFYGPTSSTGMRLFNLLLSRLGFSSVVLALLSMNNIYPVNAYRTHFLSKNEVKSFLCNLLQIDLLQRYPFYETWKVKKDVTEPQV